jgi:hypothetical protein
MYVTYINIYIYIHMLMYKKNLWLTFSRPPPLAAASRGSRAWVKCAVLLQRGVLTEDPHGHGLSREGCRVALGGGLIDFHASG